MKIYSNKNVWEATQERMRFIFDEFENVVVCISGGKDSTIVLNLAMMEAERRGRLPLDVIFIDQEAEWQGTVDYIKGIMYDKRVNPKWLQVPIKLFNATSHESDNWLHCWGEGEKWMREKDPIAIKENVYGTDRFAAMFSHFCKVEYADKLDKTCALSGVRAEESPARLMTLTSTAKYKHITWGNSGGSVMTFYPIYDWSYTDVWHAINSNHWKYNRIYDEFYRLGVPITDMRISNLHHETAVRSLQRIQEIEPKTWNKLTLRMYGINTSTKLEYKENFKAPEELPFMFSSWKEYRDFLLDGLVQDQEQNKTFKNKFASLDHMYMADQDTFDKMCKTCVASILANDYTFTKLKNFEVTGAPYVIRKIRNGKQVNKDDAKFGGKRLLEDIYG